MTNSIENKCLAKGVKLTDQRKTIARVISESKKIFTFINVVKKAFWPWDITEYRIVIKKRKAIKIPRKP